MTKKGTRETASGLRRYWEDSRDLFMSLVLVLPLFVLYQVGVLATGGLRNGVDFVTDALNWITGGQTLYYLLFNVGVLALFVGLLAYFRKRGTLQPKIIPWMFVESAVYAFFFGAIVTQLMGALGMGGLLASGGAGAAEMGVFTKLVMSVGAGLYEEFVFRLGLMGGLFWLGFKVIKLPRLAAAAGAVLISSILFSAIHHIGALGDPFTLGVFMFRFFAGVLLALIFYLRGFAIAVYTHAFYDIIVMIFR